jgi:ribonucleoside-diphosphate reductase alpha chain
MITTHEKLPLERSGVTHRFKVADLKGYLTVNCYPDGRPAEVFLTVHQVGGLERGMSHALAVMISTALQHGVPLSKIVEKLKGMTFEPQGVTGNKDIPLVKSLADYLGRWLERRFPE